MIIIQNVTAVVGRATMALTEIIVQPVLQLYMVSMSTEVLCIEEGCAHIY